VLTPILVESPTGRCGTTLMMQLLGTSSSVAFDRVYPFEIRYLSYLVRWAFVATSDQPPDTQWNSNSLMSAVANMVGPFPNAQAKYWQADSMSRGVFAASWELFSQTVRDQDGSHVLFYAEKSPRWLSDGLEGLLPHHLILLVRDPRDIFVSQEAFNRKRGYLGFLRAAGEKDKQFENRFATTMRQRLDDFVERSQTPHSLLIRYEDMIRDLKATAARLSRAIGIDLHANEVAAMVEKFRHHMTSESPEQSVGRWRREMHPRYAARLSAELTSQLSSLGYDR
jgi:sulfotransferase family protein